MGKVTETLNSNKSKDQKHKVYCAQCKRETNHVVLQSIDSDASEVIWMNKITERSQQRKLIAWESRQTQATMHSSLKLITVVFGTEPGGFPRKEFEYCLFCTD